ncbi:hypothetical protein Ciccas_008763, partial [Cichlidogyrus casuarinus]
DQPCFAVVLLPAHKKVVVVIRGTWSLADVLSDLAAAAEPINLKGIDYYGHGGMVICAKSIYDKLKGTRILDYAFAKAKSLYKDEFQLTVCGHSLGAGVTTILTAILQADPNYETVKGYAFSAPLGALSEDFGQHCRNFVVTVNYGTDIIARTGVETCDDLIERLKIAIASCPIPKWKLIMQSALGTKFCPAKYRNRNLWTMENSPGVRQAAERILDDETERSLAVYLKSEVASCLLNDDNPLGLSKPIKDKNSPVTCSPLVLHLLECSETGDFELEARSKVRYPVAVWSDPTQFKSIIIGPYVFADHCPKFLLGVLDKLCNLLDNPQVYENYSADIESIGSNNASYFRKIKNSFKS